MKLTPKQKFENKKIRFLKKNIKLVRAAWGRKSGDTLPANLAEEAICERVWKTKLYSRFTVFKDIARSLMNTYERMEKK